MIGFKHFNEAAHVRALEMMGEVGVEIDRRRGVLEPVGLVEQRYRVADTLDPDFLDGDAALVLHGLYIDHV